MTLSKAKQRQLAGQIDRAFEALGNADLTLRRVLDAAVKAGTLGEKEHLAFGRRLVGHVPQRLPARTVALLFVGREFFLADAVSDVAKLAGYRDDLLGAQLAYAYVASQVQRYHQMADLWDRVWGMVDLEALAEWDYCRDVAGQT